jgi:hypothetical protein
MAAGMYSMMVSLAAGPDVGFGVRLVAVSMCSADSGTFRG